MSLRSIDESWLPRLARRAHRLQHRAYAAVQAIGGPRSAAGHAARAEPALAGSIAAVVVAALLVATFGTHDPYDHDDKPEPTASIEPPHQTLGPRPGTSVSTYLTTAAFDLRHFGEVSHGKPGYALVALRRYMTPADVAAELPSAEVTRAYVRAPAPDLATSIYTLRIDGNWRNLALGMESQSRLARLNAKTYAQIVAGLNPKNDREKLEKKLYQKLAVAAKYESLALAKPATCACVFALLVKADFVQLAKLAALPDVRAVDPAPPSIPLDQIAVLPLRPDFTTVVPRPGVLGVG